MEFVIKDEHLIDGELPEDFVWPDGVIKVSASKDCLIKSLANIPAGVTKINLFYCKNLRSLDLSGADALQTVVLLNSAIENLTNIPAGVTKLALPNCRNLKSLDLSGADSLQEVDLSSSAIENLTNIPAGVTKLALLDCKNLQSLDLLGASGLEEVNLCYSGIENLTNIPAGITKFNLFNCRNLKSLDLSGADSLQEVDLSSSAIENLTNIPAGVTKLALLDCKNLQSLDLLGASGLEEVDLGYSGIENLTNIPASVTGLFLMNCVKLAPTPELVARLDEIEQLHPNATVVRPSHWPQWIDEAKRELSEAIASCGIVPRPHAIKDLFDRFTSEGLFARSLASIKAAGEPVIDLIKKDRSNLKWMEEIASNYLEGCVNQPVQGWLEIGGYVAMYQEPFLPHRVEASKQVLARDYIAEFVARLDNNQKPGAGVEVEFGNALMRQVHQILLENGAIKKPWLAIPAGIAFEGAIRSVLTNEVVNKAYNCIKEQVIDKDPIQLTDTFLKSRLRDGWCQAIIKGSKKISAKLLKYEAIYQSVKSQIEDDYDFYTYAGDRNSGSDDIKEVDRQKYEARYQDEFRGLIPAEIEVKITSKLVGLGERRVQIDIEKDQMLGGIILQRIRSVRPLPQAPVIPRPLIRGVAAAAVSSVRERQI